MGKRLTVIIIGLLLIFIGCSKSGENHKNKLNNTNREKKLSPDEIKHLAQLERDIITEKIYLNNNVLNQFHFGEFYYVIGYSDMNGNIAERKKAAELDAKRWGAIFMKYLLNGIVDLNLEGEHVNFLIYEGEFIDNDGSVYKIYKFRREE